MRIKGCFFKNLIIKFVHFWLLTIKLLDHLLLNLYYSIVN